MAKRTNMMYPLGVTITESGAEILVQAEAEKVSLLLFKAGEKESFEQFEFQPEDRIGDVWTMSLPGYDFKGLEYGFVADGTWFVDPYAKAVTGRKVWGSVEEVTGEWPSVRARVTDPTFNWDTDKKPSIPYADTILYRFHVRGLTKHPSSHVRNKGTFAGVVEMIPYFKSLGVTSLELMPVAEFDEVMKDLVPAETPGGNPKLKANGKLNYWGYGPTFRYVPKAAYGTGFMPVEIEFKIMVKELHDAGLECIPEMYFSGEESIPQVLDVLRYWTEEYHVDGFKLSGVVPKEAIAADPFLKDLKLFADDWSGVLAKNTKKQTGAGNPDVSVRAKRLAEYNDKFQMDMRRILRGDQGMVENLMAWTMKNPTDHAVINFMANTNGFTMMDMVTYDEKHNEANGEDNHDGTNYNASWNCGIEGPTDNEKVNKLRKQQLYNAFLMLLLSQGTPLIMAGDEFGNTQYGNNNAYCQDNEISWLDWNQLEENSELFQVVREFIRFRKEHKLFHMDHTA
ncbi:MAG: alpha-amylase, partial [Lachnospiraceae bacterium]|nr:alpha-amylase [Lachnospiraceae bacterium]